MIESALRTAGRRTGLFTSPHLAEPTERICINGRPVSAARFTDAFNRVVDNLPNSVPMAKRFQRARESVTRHYQWMLRTDFLRRICEPAVVTDVFTNGRKAFEVGAAPTDVPTMPIEFSIGSYRLGHSMVRAAYNWLVQNFEDATPLKQADELYIFGFSRGAFTVRTLAGLIHACGILDLSAYHTNAAFNKAIRKAYAEYRRHYNSLLTSCRFAEGMDPGFSKPFPPELPRLTAR